MQQLRFSTEQVAASSRRFASPARSSAWAASLLLLGCAATANDEVAPDGSTEGQRPNIVLVLVDDLGWGDLSCYGQTRFETPELDRMAAEGLRFEQFYAGATVCAPSRSALMTGQHTGHTRIRGNRRQDLLPEDVTLAEVLRDAGYRTAMFGKWGLGTEEGSGHPVRQGFEEFYGYLSQRHAHNYYPTFLIDGEQRTALPNVVPNEDKDGAGKASVREVYSHDAIVGRSLEWLAERDGSEPFFLCLTWALPHANNEAGREGMEVPDFGGDVDAEWPAPEQGFVGMVRRMDRDLGRLRAQLAEQGLADNTLLIFTSDNGPHSEGGHKADYFDSNGPFTGLKRDLTEGGIRVPCLAVWPGRTPVGETTATSGAFWDFLPTFAELAEAEADESAWDGRSLVSALEGRAEAPEQSPDLYWAFYERGAARALLHARRWKVVHQPLKSEPRLYDLVADPAERNDLAAQEPELLAELIERMDAADVPGEGWVLPIPGR